MNSSLSGMRRYLVPLLCLAALLLLTWLAARQCHVNLRSLATGLPNALGNLKMFLQPEWSIWPLMLRQSVITVAISLLATPLAAALSLPLGLAAARNLSPSWLRFLMRTVLGFERVLPDIFVLLLLVTALGLGPAPAVIALVIASLGMLGKLFADAMEEVDERVIDSLRATGAGYWQVVRYAVLPKVKPNLISHIIFRFEVNVRAATLLGAVSGQGIGHELLRSISYLEYGRATVAILFIVALVLLCERLSDFARKHLLAEGKLR